MSRGKAVIKADYPGRRVEKFRCYVGRNTQYRKLWTGWTRLHRLCRSLAQSAATYTVQWEFTDRGATAHIVWEVQS